MSSCPNCIFENHQLWQSGFSRVYSNCYCSCSFESEIIKIGQSSHKIYSNKILNSKESMTILNACTKTSGNLLNAPRRWALHYDQSSPIFSPYFNSLQFILYFTLLLPLIFVVYWHSHLFFVLLSWDDKWPYVYNFMLPLFPSDYNFSTHPTKQGV